MSNDRARIIYALLVIAGLSAAMFLPILTVFCAIILFLFFVARHDNESGSYLILATLGVIVLITMLLLVAGLSVIHRMMSG